MSEGQETTTYTDLWRVMQEMGAAINDMDDLPDVLRALSAALDEAHPFVEERALEECADDE